MAPFRRLVLKDLPREREPKARVPTSRRLPSDCTFAGRKRQALMTWSSSAKSGGRG